MPLCELTRLRLLGGPKPIAECQTGDMAYDAENRLVPIVVGPRVKLKNPHRLRYPPRGAQNCSLVDHAEVNMSGDHPLHLRTSTLTEPYARRQQGRKQDGYNLRLHVRCEATQAAEAEAAQELKTLKQLRNVPLEQLHPDVMAAVADDQEASSEDGSSTSCAEQGVKGDIDTDGNAGNNSLEDNASISRASSASSLISVSSLDEDEWRESPLYANSCLWQYIDNLKSKPDCFCGGVRALSVSCHTKSRAQELLRVAKSASGAVLLHRNLVRPGEDVSLTARQFMASPHCDNPIKGPIQSPILKIVRFPFEKLPFWSTVEADLPLDAWWLGLWLGDGCHLNTSITTIDPETVAKIRAYVARLNLRRPPGKYKLRVTVRESFGPLSENPVWEVAIVSRWGAGYWNPVRAGLRKLGLLGSHKKIGIPAAYRTADQPIRSALLAGLFDSDGCLVEGAYYSFSQARQHNVLYRHVRKLAAGLGIRVGRTTITRSRSPMYPARKNIQYNCQFFGPELELVQPYLALYRKLRKATHYKEKEARPVRVDRLNWAEDYGREVRVAGREKTLLQLEDGYIVRTDNGSGAEDDGFDEEEEEEEEWEDMSEDEEE